MAIVRTGPTVLLVAGAAFAACVTRVDVPFGRVCPPGLLAHWTFDAADVSGTTVRDVSGNGYDGVLTGVSPTVGPGVIGQALIYPTNAMGYVNVPALALDTSAGGVNTVAMWFYRAASPVTDEVLIYAPSAPRYDLWLTTNAGKRY